MLPHQRRIPTLKEGEPVDIAAYTLQLRTKGLGEQVPTTRMEGGLDQAVGDELAIWEDLHVDRLGPMALHEKEGALTIQEQRPRGRHRWDLSWTDGGMKRSWCLEESALWLERS